MTQNFDLKFNETACNVGLNFKEIYVAKIPEPGKDGQTGRSAYEVAVANGFSGSEQEWLASLKGQPGEKGEPGKDGYTPQRGADYWTETDRSTILNELLTAIGLPIPTAADNGKRVQVVNGRYALVALENTTARLSAAVLGRMKLGGN